MEDSKRSANNGGTIVNRYYQSSKPLNFKLNRHSFPEMESDCNLTSSIVSRIHNSNSSNNKILNTISRPKKRRFSLNKLTYLLPRSVRINAIINKRKIVSYPNSPHKLPIDYHAVSLNSSNVSKILSNDSEELNSTVNSEISHNNSTVALATEFPENDSTVVSEFYMNKSTTPSESSTYELNSTKNESSTLNWSQFSGDSSAAHSSCEDISEDEIEDTFDYDSIKEDVVPIFAGYQLIGDSQLLRFSQKILGLEREFSHSSSGSLGLCVSGQKISDLHRRVLEKFHPVGEQVILLIGTNDLLKGTSSSGMCRGLKFLVQDILLSAKKIVVLTLPPVPKLAHREDHWTRLDTYNDYIKSLPEEYRGKLSVVDISPYFYKPSTRVCRHSYFEKWFYGGRRKDLIHINEEGFKVIRHFLLKRAL